MRILVTGATGFLGSHVAHALERRGHEVVRFARSLGGDVLDAKSVAEAAAGCRAVLHCAGRVSRKPEDAEALYDLHVRGTKTVLDACAEAGVARAVVSSTSGTVAVSDDPDHVGREDDAAPIGIVSRWPYYRAKLFAERAALERSRPGFEVVAVNPSLLLGPGDDRGSSTEDVRNFLEGVVPAVPAGGLSFVDARDAAEAMALALEAGRAGERYLVGACNLTVRDFFARLSRISGVPAPWLPMPRSREIARIGARAMERLASRIGIAPRVDAPSVEMAQCFWYLDASKAERELGWRARDPNVTLHDTVDDLRARGVVWPTDDSARGVVGEGPHHATR
ncbi:MAG TPA: NAD-dependent epimerase/dehydratase family protein [Polyangiaceae bacterium]|nr:NAD-dependent epimerase/dehydratase family protein [Polyangiaceae bacterium]